jgi:uncharacterized lipoprotein YddW (UPF0748 family)
MIGRGSRTVAAAVLLVLMGNPPVALRAATVRVVPRTALASREAVELALASAVTSGVESLLVPVDLFAELPALLVEMVPLARSRGLRVVAAVDLTLAASANEWPASRDHVIYAHPEWLMVPRELTRELARVDFHSPDYTGRLARWARANAAKAAGLYVSPLQHDAAAFVAGAIGRLVEQVPFDGVQFEAARFPSDEFDYSRLALEALREDVRAGLSSDERRRLDGVEALDALAYVHEFPDAWRRLRQTRLTALVVRARTAVKAARPQTVVSAVVGSDPLAALSEYLQDWPTWLDNRFVDAVTVDAADVPPPGRLPQPLDR